MGQRIDLSRGASAVRSTMRARLTAVTVLAGLLLALPTGASASNPAHPRNPGLDVTGLYHPLGVVTNSK